MSQHDDEEDPVTYLCNDIWKKLPDLFNTEEIALKFPVLYENSMNTVLRQEVVRFNGLLKYLKHSLLEVQKAIVGQIAMIPQLERIYDQMLIGKLPDAWAKKSYPSLKPLGSYILDLLERLNFLNKWILSGEPQVYWLSGFYFTQSFLTGVMQNYSRKNHQQIDLLSVTYEVTGFESDVKEAAEVGVYIKVSTFSVVRLKKKLFKNIVCVYLCCSE
jgi:dynein heavy chain, axonemal